MELSPDIKQRMKDERLNQYKAQLFCLEMDLVAYTALGDESLIEQTKKAIEQGKTAYKAIEAM